MFAKLKLFWEALQQGKELANPEFWKKVQSEGQPVLAAFFVAVIAITKGTKFEIPMDDSTAGLIAGGVFSVTNWYLTKATSKKVGLPPIEDHSGQ